MHNVTLPRRGLNGVCAALVLECAAPRLNKDVGRTRADDLAARRDTHIAAVRIRDFNRRVLARNRARNRRAALCFDGNARRGRDIAEIRDLVRTREVHGMRVDVERRHGFEDARRGHIARRLDGDAVGESSGQRHVADRDVARAFPADADLAEALAVRILLQQTGAAENIGGQNQPRRRAAPAGRTEGNRLARRIGVEGYVAVPCDLTVRMMELVRLYGDVAVVHAVRIVCGDRRIIEIDLAAADGVVLAVRIDRARDVDAARTARDCLLDVDGKGHVDRTALVKVSAAVLVADVDDLIVPECTVISIEIFLEQG